jgi:hypothetical protein
MDVKSRKIKTPIKSSTSKVNLNPNPYELGVMQSDVGKKI